MNLEFGTEQRFLDFINDIRDDDVVALISHTDLDGITAAKVANMVLNAKIIKFVNYSDLHLGLVKELKELGATKIVFTDLNIGNELFLKELESFSHILILDHHVTPRDWNSSRTSFIKVEAGYCAGYLCYALFSNIHGLHSIEWLVACSCISDYCHVKPRAWLDAVFSRYNDSLELEGTCVRKSGPIWDVQYTLSLALIYHQDNVLFAFNSLGEHFGSMGDLSRDAEEVDQEIRETLKSVRAHRIGFHEGYFIELNPRFPISSIVSTIISSEEPSKTHVVLRPDAHLDIYHVSARRQDSKHDMGAFLKKLVEGFEKSSAGGHIPAAGGSFPKKYLSEFKRRLGVAH